jgi:thiamine-monophosphate kinase
MADTPPPPDDPQPAASEAQPAAAEAQHTSIADVGEFGLIGHMREVLGPVDDDTVLMGIADDAAVYRVRDGRVHVVTTDALVEGVHFDRTFAPMQHLGFKALSVNVSDVVAMNAAPRYATVTLGVPQNVSVEMLGALYGGLRQACRAYDVAVIGGDTVAAPSLTLSITVIGEASEDAVVYRRGAQPGDALVVTGDLGASYAGLKVLLDQRDRLQAEGEAFRPDFDRFSYCVRRHLAPPAQLQAIRDWAEAGVRPRALIDISDGLASEAHHVCEASGVGALVFGPSLPVHRETAAVAEHFDEGVDAYVLFGGEDYELLAALAPDDLAKLDSERVSVVGQVTPAEEGVRLRTPEGEEMPLRPGGFDHFSEG